MLPVKCPICNSSSESLGIVIQDAPIFHVVSSSASITKEFFDCVELRWCPSCDHYTNIGTETGVGLDSPFLTNGAVSLEMRSRQTALCNFIGKWRSPRLSVLDIGAGSCGYANAFAAAGHRVVALEPSLSVEPLYESIEVIRETWPTAQLSGREFDLILLIQVIEHMIQPFDSMRKVLDLLRPNGLVYVEIPSGDWVLENGAIFDVHAPHKNYFTRHSIQKLFSRLGLKIIEVRNLENRDVGYLLESNVELSKVAFPNDTFSPRHQKLALSIDKLSKCVNFWGMGTALYGANANSQSLLGLIPDLVCRDVYDDTPEYWGGDIYSKSRRLKIARPSKENFDGISRIVIASYMHDKQIAQRLRNLGFSGEIRSLRPPSAVYDGPLSLI